MAHCGEFLLAHEPHPPDGTFHLGADETNHQLPIGPALLDQVVGDLLYLRGDHFRALAACLDTLVNQR